MSGFQSRDAQQNLGGAFGPMSPGRCQREIERRLGITSTSTEGPAVAHVPAAAQAMPVPRRSLSGRIMGAVWPAGGVVAGTPVVQSSSGPTAVVAGTPVVVSGTPVAPVVAPARGDGTTFRAHLHQIYAAPGATPAVAVVEGAPVQPARSLSGRLYDRLPSSSDLYNALPSRPRVLSGSGGQTATREPILPAATPRSDAATLRSPSRADPSRPADDEEMAVRVLAHIAQADDDDVLCATCCVDKGDAAEEAGCKCCSFECCCSIAFALLFFIGGLGFLCLVAQPSQPGPARHLRESWHRRRGLRPPDQSTCFHDSDCTAARHCDWPRCHPHHHALRGGVHGLLCPPPLACTATATSMTRRARHVASELWELWTERTGFPRWPSDPVAPPCLGHRCQGQVLPGCLRIE